MKSKHLVTLLDIVTSNISIADYAKKHGLNYKTTTNQVFYGKKLYNQYKRKNDPVLKRIDNIRDRNAIISGLTRVTNMYKANPRKGKRSLSTNSKTRMGTHLPYHFDTYASMDEAWKSISSRIKDGEDMSLLIKFYNTIVKESNKIIS